MYEKWILPIAWNELNPGLHNTTQQNAAQRNATQQK